MKIEQLKHFVEAVDCKSLSAAAKKLFISQSALSQSVSNLEQDLGVKLLFRSNRGITPTTLGRVIYDDSRQLLETVNGLEEKWTSMVDTSLNCNGELRIVTIPGAINTLIDSVIPEIMITFPNVVVSPFEAQASANEPELMKTYNASVCIGSCPFTVFEMHRRELEKEGWIVDVLCSADPNHLLVSSKNPISKLKFIHDYELSSLPLVYYSYEHTPKYTEYFDLSRSIKMQQRNMILRCVASNSAVAVFPGKITEAEPYVKRKQMGSIPIITNDYDAFPPVSRYLIHKANDQLSSVEQEAISIIKFYFTCSD